MDFEPTPEQRLLRESAERFVRAHPGPARAGLWQEFAALGWLALPLSEEAGGFGGSSADVAVLMEALGAGHLREPFVSSILLAGRLIDRLAGPPWRARLLAPLIEGRLRLALAHHEPQMRFALTGVETLACAVAGGWRLSGRKVVVLDAGDAHAIVLSARLEGTGALALFLVDAQAEGLRLRPYCRVDGGRAADLELDGVMLEQGRLLASGEAVETALARVIDQTICALCAEAVGAMRQTCAITRDYIATRQQFGAPIGTQQAVRHRWADMLIATEEAKSITDLAAIFADGDPAEAAVLVSAAKAKVAEAGRFVGEQGIQLHGAMGMTEDSEVGRFYKRLLMIAVLFGDADHHARRAAGAA